MNQRGNERALLVRDKIANLLRLGSLVAIALGLFAVVSGGLAVYLNLSAQIELERAETAAARHAARIGDALSNVQTSLRDASVVDAARSGDDESLRRALRERGTTGIIDARVLPAQIGDIALGDEQGMDFAATEAAIEAIRNERAEIRVVTAGTADEHLVFAQRLPGGSGVLLLRLTTSVVTSLLEGDEALAFAALAQDDAGRYAVLDATGRAAAARVRNLPIEGSRLVFQWSRSVAAAPVDNQSAVIVGASGILVLMLGLLVRRRTRVARYLEQPPARQEDRAPRQRARASSDRAGSTLVLGPDGRTPGAGAHESDEVEEDDDDEEATVVAGSPDLPEWLQERKERKR